MISGEEKTEFAYSAGALRARRHLLVVLKIISLAAGLAVLFLTWPQGGAARLLGITTALGLVFFFWRARNDSWLGVLAGQTIRVQAAAIELKRGKFTRFIMFSEISQVRVQRLDDDAVVAIIIHSPEGPLVIRGFEDMELIFGYVSARKPDTALVQIEDVRGWSRNPQTWLAIIGVLAMAGSVLCLIM